jgi:hypothetical protein
MSDTHKNTGLTTRRSNKLPTTPGIARMMIVAKLSIFDFIFVAWLRKCHFAETNAQARAA